MKLKTITLSAILFLQQSIAISQINPLIKYLPANASMVMTLNLLQLGHKISGETFHQSVIYREMMKKPSPELNAFFADPSGFGLDLSSDLFIVYTTDTSLEFPGTSVHIFGLLKDEAVFSRTIEKLINGKDSINVYGTNKILFSRKGGPTLAWNNEVFVINIVNSRSHPKKGDHQLLNDSSEVDINKTMNDAAAVAETVQRNLCFALLTPHPQNSFSSNNIFINLVNTPGDIKTWGSGTINPAFNKMVPFAVLVSKLQTLSGKNKTAVVNFENGKIVVKSRTYLEEPMAAIYKKYPPTSINTDLSRRLPKGKLLAMVNLSYNPEMSKEMIRQSGMQGVMDSIKKIFPFDFSSMNAAFQNNLMLTVIKVDEVSPDDSITQKMGGIQVILAMPIADKAKFLELKVALSRALDSLRNTDTGSRTLKGFHPYLQSNDGMFVMSSSPYAAKAFLNDNGNNPAPEWLQSYAQHPMLMRIDMKALLSLVLNKKSPGNTGIKEQKFMNMFDQVVIYGGEYENDALTSTLEFRFTNQTDNALKQLFDMINLAAEGK